MVISQDSLNTKFNAFEDTMELHRWLEEFVEEAEQEKMIDGHSVYMLKEILENLQGLYALAYSFKYYHNRSYD